MSWTYITLYLKNILIEVIYFTEVIIKNILLFFSYFDLIVDISETFGLFLILSIISMNSVNLLVYIFNNYNTKSTKITSSNLFLVNNFTKFIQDQRYHWLLFK